MKTSKPTPATILKEAPATARPPFTLPPDRLRMMVELLVDVACPELRLPESAQVKPCGQRKPQRTGSGSTRGSNDAANSQP